MRDMFSDLVNGFEGRTGMKMYRCSPTASSLMVGLLTKHLKRSKSVVPTGGDAVIIQSSAD
jgi:hypothetical protein